MNALDFLKVVGSNIILTGYRDKYNDLVDTVIYDCTAELNSTKGTVLTFYQNHKTFEVIVPVSLASLTDVTITSPIAGQVLTYDSVSGKWKNISPLLSTLFDVTIDNTTLVENQTLHYSGSNWINKNPLLENLFDVTIDNASLVENQTLHYSGSNWINKNPLLENLFDVNLTNPIDGQTIIRDGSNWINATPALATLSDVDLDNPQPKDVLLYDGTNWVNGISENNDYTSTVFINDGDPYTTAISNLDEILGLLAPAKPGNMSTKTLTVSPIYTSGAIQSKTGTVRTVITDDTTPIIEITPYTATPASTNNGVYNAAAGNLTATLIKDQAGSPNTETTSPIEFTIGDESGQLSTSASGDFRITVTHDFDYHFGVSGRAGFWRAFLSRVQVLNALSSYPAEQHNVTMSHSQTGSTNLTFFVDDPQTPSIASAQMSTPAAGTTRISGVPTLSTGDSIRCQFTLNNAIRTFYIAGLANAQSSSTNSVTTNESGIKTHGSAYSADLSPVVQSGRYIENLVMTLNGYNSKYATTNAGNFATTTTNIASTQTGKTLRIDTVSNESARRKSGSGQYPLTGYGATYDSTELLTANEELQMINGVYRYPYLDHSNNYPVAGPNYSTLTGWRYVTFPITLTADQNVTVTFNTPTNFGNILNPNQTMNSSHWRLYVKAESSTGWIDGNAAYSSGNPIVNGAPAMVVAASNAATKTVTFGTATYSGTCYVRIGLNDSAKSFPISFASVTIAAS